MTLKHISFLQSSVMRNFERVAVDKGLVKPEVLKKEASDKRIIASDDLYGDMLKLANELKAKGYVKQADSLENKVFLTKQAEIHLYRVFDTDGDDLLDFAHPDGDVKISDSQDEYGMVETPQSAHQKMVEMVKKNPTGKAASSLVENIVKAAAIVLGQEDLIKKAEGERQGVTTLEHIRPESQVGDESFEDRFSEDFVERAGKIKAINAYIETSWPKIVKMANEVSSAVGVNSPDSVYKFSSEYIFKKNDIYNELYCTYAQINKEALDSFIIKNNEIFGEANPSVEFIVDKIKSLGADPEAGGALLKSFADKVSKGLGSTYFSGVINPDEKNTFKNPNSIWEVGTLYGYNLVDKNVNAAAKAIYDSFMAQFAAVINVDLIEKASAGLVSEVKGLISGVGEVINYFSSPFELEPNAKSVSGLLGDLNSQLNIMSQLSPKSKVGIRLRGLMAPMGANVAVFDNVLEMVVKTISDAINFISKNHLSEGDALVMDVDSVYNDFYQSAKLWADLMKSHDKNSNDYENYRSNGAESYKLSQIVGAGKGKPFVQIMKEIKEAGIKGFSAKNWEQFVGEAEKWLADSTKMVEAAKPVSEQPASADDGVIKKAELKGTGAPSKSPAVSSAKPGALVGNSAEEKAAVKLMQDALNSIGTFLEQTGKYDRAELMKLRDTGQGPNTASGDGDWGPRTAKALETANKLLELNLVTNRNPATATKDAKSNYATLQKYVSSLNAGKANDNAVLDSIPRKIDWQGAPEAASIGNPDVKVTGNDLSSLGALYRFLVKNGMEQPVSENSETEIGTEGFTLNQWGNILMWFRKRAVFTYHVAERIPEFESARNTAKTYFNKVDNLFKQYSGMIKNLGSSLNGTDGKFVIPESYLNQMSSTKDLKQLFEEVDSSLKKLPRFKMEDGSGSGSRMTRSERGQGIEEGYSMELPPEEDNTPPIGPMLDLRRRNYFTISLQGMAYNQISFKNFRNMDGINLAKMMFGNEDGKPSKDEQRQVLTSAGLGSNVAWDEGLGEYKVNWKGTMIPVSKLVTDREFSTYYNTNGLISGLYDLRAADPVKKFQNFLYKLSNDIKNAAEKWSARSGTTSKEVEIMQRWSQSWTQLISEKLEDIKNWRSPKSGY